MTEPEDDDPEPPVVCAYCGVELPMTRYCAQPLYCSSLCAGEEDDD